MEGSSFAFPADVHLSQCNVCHLELHPVGLPCPVQQSSSHLIGATSWGRSAASDRTRESSHAGRIFGLSQPGQSRRGGNTRVRDQAVSSVWPGLRVEGQPTDSERRGSPPDRIAYVAQSHHHWPKNSGQVIEGKVGTTNNLGLMRNSVADSCATVRVKLT